MLLKNLSQASFKSCRWLLSHNLQVLSFLLSAKSMIWQYEHSEWFDFTDRNKNTMDKNKCSKERLSMSKIKITVFALTSCGPSYVQTSLLLISSSPPHSPHLVTKSFCLTLTIFFLEVLFWLFPLSMYLRPSLGHMWTTGMVSLPYWHQPMPTFRVLIHLMPLLCKCPFDHITYLLHQMAAAFFF